jgi:hypothetical protein
MNRPAWYNEEIHSKVCDLLESSQKLQAVKYLCDESTKHGTRSEYGLKEMKELCDEIAPPMFRVPAPNEIPVYSMNAINRETLAEEVIEELETMDYTNYSKGQLRRMLAHVPDNVLREFLDRFRP